MDLIVPSIQVAHRTQVGHIFDESFAQIRERRSGAGKRTARQAGTASFVRFRGERGVDEALLCCRLRNRPPSAAQQGVITPERCRGADETAGDDETASDDDLLAINYMFDRVGESKM